MHIVVAPKSAADHHLHPAGRSLLTSTLEFRNTLHWQCSDAVPVQRDQIDASLRCYDLS